MNVPAWAENAVVVSDDGRTVRYHYRCPMCGKVDTRTTMSIYVGPGILANNMVLCSTCHKSFPVKFGRK